MCLVTDTAVIVTATDGITFPQLTGVIVFVTAILVGCMLCDAVFRRY